MEHNQTARLILQAICQGLWEGVVRHRFWWGVSAGIWIAAVYHRILMGIPIY